MKQNPPYRIGAWLSADKDEVRLIGYGTYVGDERPPRPMGFTAWITRGAKTWEEANAMFIRDLVEDGMPEEKARALLEGSMRFTNPKLVMDSGEVVWGCECWWDAEDNMRAAIGGRRIVQVDIEAERRRAEAPSQEAKQAAASAPEAP